ncbi:succinate dehydrogenase, hydrophobic membrane anchor protein [Candidatus Tisiphia endosymbiont of Hybos culiciformis]|uniref:succinate dehydrogenase, hydrophobic membrane anchor protein n=1 Tax=Candidatus Tisiphia endosymbiont of Hybos culiciformis TaxID=3139331 RepID=UPI003CCAD4A5
MNNNLRTDLAKSASSHWLHQRITAIILAICSIWLIFFIKCNMGKDLTHFVGVLQKPYNIVPLGILIITTFYHSMLGMQVVIEDYISCIKLRIGLIIFLKIFCIITIAFLVVALFYAILL